MQSKYSPVSLSIVLSALMGVLAACGTPNPYSWNVEDSGPPPAALPPDTPNPFVPVVVPTVPGSVPTTYTDSFSQAASGKVDIVWMIDSSGSMKNNQEAIQTNADAFMSKLQDASVDFKLIVVTTDLTDDLWSHNRCGSVITSSNESQFATCAIVGDQGSGFEEGLEAVRRALDPNYVHGALNPGFLRADADLQIVYVSDEEDQPDPDSWLGRTINGATITASDVSTLRAEEYYDLADPGHVYDGLYGYFPLVANHVSFLQSLKSGATKVRAHAIVTTKLDGSDACHTRGYGDTEEVGQRYIAVANFLGGSVSDICGDWSTTMNDLGLQASGLEKCFILAHVPTDRTSIAVTINDVAVDAADFTFVPTGNQVCFNTIPAVGSAIRITYY